MTYIFALKESRPMTRAHFGRKLKQTFTKFMTVVFCFSLIAPSLSISSARAQGSGLIRDAEIEGLMRLYSQPIFKAAGLNPRAVKVYLINQPSINAFVAGGQRIFIHTGLLQQAKNPGEVIGVIAHETGHIAGGHLARLGNEMDKASNYAIISMLVGMAVIAGGAVAGSNDAARVGQAAIFGGQNAAKRNVLSYIRAQEAAADQAAIRYLTKSKQSGKGMLSLFNTLASKSLGSLRYTDPYVQTHPMPFQRINNLKRLVKKSPYYNKKTPAGLMLRHRLMQAKLDGFVSSPRVVYRKYPKSDRSLYARYARAIVTFRSGDIRNAIPMIDGLIKTIPQNPYFWELKGQALIENGQPARAIKPLKVAVKQTAGNGLISMLLAKAYLGAGGKANAKKAMRILIKAKRYENQSADLHLLLARAYAVSGIIAKAELETAEAAIRSGDKQLAQSKARKAMKRMKRGSPGWQRAKDIVNFAGRK